MLLCQTHYNQLIFHESLKIEQAKTCQHPKHEIYLNEAKLTKKANINKNLTKVPKRLIEVLELDEFTMICSMCRKKTDKDSEYSQNEKYKTPILTKNNNLSDDDNSQNESVEIEQINSCQHPKHKVYSSETKSTNKQNKNKSLIKVPKRLVKVLGLDEYALICNKCKKRTDDDDEYLQNEEYEAPISRKNNNDNNILKIGNHVYSFRKDILYTGEELKQLESDYQDILAQSTISNEISLSSKIIKMSNILYNNQYKLKQKPIYNPIDFKTMLETADKDLIGFFDELYAETSPNKKINKTNESNKKKLVSLCYFLVSINNKYINGLKADVGSYL